MVDQLSSGMIGAVAISRPPAYKTAIYRDSQIALALEWLEKWEVQNLEGNEQMIIRDGELAIIMQQQKEDKAQKSMEKE